MSWSEFYLIVSGLITLVLLIIAFPFLRNKNHAKRDSLSNTQIIRQRLLELEREVKEGLISEIDKRQAVDELKIALVDESAFTAKKTGTAPLVLIVGGLIALICGAVVYSQVNQMSQVKRSTDAIAALPQLSQQLANGNANSLTQQDIADLALAIRQRLRDDPSDDTGWMYLGRLMLSIGQEVQAIEAIDRATVLAPANSGHKITLAQALMTTGDVNNLQRAQAILNGLLANTPDNDNLALMMAVVSAQVGDLAQTKRYYAQVKDKLPNGSDMQQRLTVRIAELEARASGMAQLTGSTDGSTDGNMLAPGESSNMPDTALSEPSKVKTGFAINVELSEEAKVKAPKEGFLIVFAQDALSENRMPAAVVKMPIGAMPAVVTLSNKNAMMPQYTLGSLSDITITARLSIDGDVSISSGEWQGSTSAQVKQGQMPELTVIINKEL
ncbi:c-type cytochrome biogenesis protein CcmI [Alteromonas sp.]|jgi:cytochrome c-type biogenesis protein CcmI|uniref:c-type cytochrome biogenesis protein CcmI n=1 Tax=Alteromonas sp. TaxID=232 RepID=UPI000B72DA92|nr:c-type cytochrome biogenesis protein CcmI [Alteromonas sp.]MAI39520.1 c-type cytochrome biogenesis protein CcmI [Alteromonas sp.]OUX83642.1 MAG: c-type cytochrome biogenesis protein CcmI [Alteromonas sp. TMED35]|tara:strand:+ start:25337 stop:26662 length:1326 start_codon:yes stop_codon:yes gene_type:complete